MKLEEMKYFVEIVNARSINQASKTLLVAQPALSRVLNNMEKELGFPLLDRSNHGIMPTKAGLAVYADCMKILRLYNDSERHWQDIAYESSNTHITVCITALPMLCNSTMNQLFCDMAQKYPRIQLKLFERQLQDVLQETISQPYSICVSHYNQKTKDDIYQFAKVHHYQIIPLFDDEYKFFASQNHPLANKKLFLADLKSYTLATYAPNSETETVHQFADAGLTGFQKLFEKCIFLSNRYTIMDLAAANQAICLGCDIAYRQEPHRKNNNLLALDVTDFHLPITYFIMLNATPSVEERIVADTIFRYYLALTKEE